VGFVALACEAFPRLRPIIPPWYEVMYEGTVQALTPQAGGAPKNPTEKIQSYLLTHTEQRDPYTRRKKRRVRENEEGVFFFFLEEEEETAA
jgi:hypothetical protein